MRCFQFLLRQIMVSSHYGVASSYLTYIFHVINYMLCTISDIECVYETT